MLELIPLFPSWKNSLAGVNRLPPEILAKVARFLPYRDVYTGLRVCRYWHDAIMAPEVWADIDLDRTYDAQIFLVRSKEAPVCVRIAQLPDRMQLLLLRNCSSRIRSLDISSRAVERSLLTHFSDTSAPLMRDLRISRNLYSPEYLQLPSTFFTGNLPSLKTLVLSDISTDFTHLVLPNLTTFELKNVTDPDATLSLSKLLDFFERSSLLESLEFDYHTHYDGRVAQDKIVALRHMKYIRINGRTMTPSDTSGGILAHLSLPSRVIFDISIHIHGPDVDLVALTIPPRHELILSTKLPESIWFQRSSESECLMLFTGRNGAFRINARWEGIHDFAAQAICCFGSLDVSKVGTLVVDNHGGSHQYFTQALRSLTNLRSLTVSLFDHAPAPLYALRQEGTSPLLRHFAMDLFDGCRVHVEDLWRMAKVRKLRGQKLETLGLDLSSGSRLVGDISSLKRYVGTVKVTTDGGAG